MTIFSRSSTCFNSIVWFGFMFWTTIRTKSISPNSSFVFSIFIYFSGTPSFVWIIWIYWTSPVLNIGMVGISSPYERNLALDSNTNWTSYCFTIGRIYLWLSTDVIREAGLRQLKVILLLKN